MPNVQRPSDAESRQEWLTDTSNEGKESGDISLEVMFDQDDPNGEWTTHVFKKGENDKRMNRGQKTAIVIEGLSRDRERAITSLIHQDIVEVRGTQRSKILGLLGRDEHLKWVA